jgi:hypothetical protein
MDMVAYLTDIEYAARRNLETLWHERDGLRELQERVARLTRQTEEGYRQADAIMNDELVPDDDGLGVLIHYETYFGPDKERFHADAQLQELTARMAARAFSVAAAAAALLQNAKDGISLVHHGPKACPVGRPIGTQFLKDVIWNGRNQGLHWGEGTRGGFNSAVEGCFQKLAAEVDGKFSQYKQRNMAFDVVDLLGWRTWENFRDDLMTLK